ncbi:MAG: glycosyltransferase family 4 protein [Clostridiaceae bacterium]
MKILVLNYEYPPIGGGASPVAADLSRHLFARGHEVCVVTMAYKDLPKQETVDGVEVHRVKCLRTKAFVCYPWEQMTYLIAARRFLKQHLKTHSYDVVHSHFIFPTGLLAAWLKKKYGLPFVSTAHGSDVEGYNQNRFRFLHKMLRKPWKKICAEASFVTAPSPYLRELILKADPSVRCEIVPNGINTDTYRQGPKEHAILTLCRLQMPKGVQDVIRAFAALQIEGWVLRVAGDGPYRPELEKIAAECGVSDRVQFLGWIDNKSDLLKETLARAGVFASMSRFESFGISAAEAVASGCRVVLSDIPAHRQFTAYGAELVSLEDGAALQSALKSAMQAPIAAPISVEVLDWRGIVKTLERLLERARDAANTAKSAE